MVASLEVVVVVEAVEVVVAEVVLDDRLVTPLKKTLMKTLTKTMAWAIEGAMAGTMTLAMTMTLTMTMTMIMTMVMTMTMTIDLDVADVVEGVVLEGLHMDVAVMGLDHPARTTRGQTHVLMAPPQPGDTTIIPDAKGSLKVSCLYVE